MFRMPGSHFKALKLSVELHLCTVKAGHIPKLSGLVADNGTLHKRISLAEADTVSCSQLSPHCVHSHAIKVVHNSHVMKVYIKLQLTAAT